MRRSIVTILIALLLLTAVFAGCQSSGGDKTVIGVLMPTKSLQRWNQDGDNMKTQLEAKGYEVDLQYADNDVAKQVTQIENMITKGVDVLVVASIDGGALGGVLADAKEDEIPVIAYDRLIMDTDAVDYYATFDNEKVGTIQGEYIVEMLGLADGEMGPFTMEVFAGSPDDNNAKFFNKGAIDVLTPYIESGVLVIKSGQGTTNDEWQDIGIMEWKSEGAQARMDNLLSGYYADENIDVVLSPNDSLAQGIAASLDAAGYGSESKPYPILTGQDCDVNSVKNIIAGKQSMSVFKDTRTLAAQVVDMVVALVSGETVPVNGEYDNNVKQVPSYLCEPVFADIENYESLLVESGYYSADELGVEAAEPVEEVEGKTVGVLMPTKSLQRWNQDGDNMKTQLEEQGFAVDLQYADNDVAKQVTQIENMITKGVDLLVVASIDGGALGGVLADAKEEGIPVIAYDRLIMDTDAVDYYATFDNEKVGTIQGEYIVEKLGLANGEMGPFTMEVFAGSPDDNNAKFFNKGAIDVLTPYIESGVLVIKSGQGTTNDEWQDIGIMEWKSEGAQARMDNLLSGYYADENIDVVLSPNDSLAQGIAASLDAAGYGSESKPYPILTGQDCDVNSVKNIIAGKQSMSVFKDTRTLAAQVVDMCIAILTEQDVPVNGTYDNNVKDVPSYLCEPVFADIENYESLLIDSGYYSADDLK